MEYKSYQVGRLISRAVPSAQCRLAVLTYLDDSTLPATYFDNIRQQWYGLAANFKPQEVCDLGTIVAAPQTLQMVLQDLADKKITAIILSDNYVAAALAIAELPHRYNSTKPHISLIDSHIDYDVAQADAPFFVNQLMKNITQINILGYQTYFADPLALAQLDKLGGDLFRLGQLSANIDYAEPILRNSSFTYFQLSAIRAADAVSVQRPQSIGLSAQDACRLVRYAALSDALECLYIDGYQPQAIPAQKDTTALVIAQMIWFATQGVLSRFSDFPTLPIQLEQYIVLLKEFDAPTVFFHNPRSERWWFALPDWQNVAIDQHNHLLLACTYDEFVQAQAGELSERLWRKII
jgi:formiminoglutamase